jgi:hypothetical protein
MPDARSASVGAAVSPTQRKAATGTPPVYDCNRCTAGAGGAKLVAPAVDWGGHRRSEVPSRKPDIDIDRWGASAGDSAVIYSSKRRELRQPFVTWRDVCFRCTCPGRGSARRTGSGAGHGPVGWQGTEPGTWSMPAGAVPAHSRTSACRRAPRLRSSGRRTVVVRSVASRRRGEMQLVTPPRARSRRPPGGCMRPPRASTALAGGS